MGKALFIILGVFVILFGLFGEMLFGVEGSIARPAIIFGVLLFFVAGWMGIRKRKRRLREIEEEEILKQEVRRRYRDR